MLDALLQLREWLIGGLTLTVMLLSAGHAIVHKRDVRAAIGWSVFILSVPLAGAILYFTLGINRIERRAMSLRAGLMSYRTPARRRDRHLAEVVPRRRVPTQFERLSNLVGDIVHDQLYDGNLILPLTSGRLAYEAMLRAIGEAEQTVMMSTYIFDHDEAGQRFRAALAAAHERGVEVRVLIDAVGERYSWPSMVKALRRQGVRAATFLGNRLPWWWPYFNLRNHRKLLIVDGTIAFTGGMNVRHGHLLDENPTSPVADLHFRVEGPVVATLREVFAEDWTFTTHESLDGDLWFPPLEERGDMVARGIADGPDHRFQHLAWTLMGALACARESVRIVTPYFLPDTGLTYALATAARRGVRVEIFLPEKNNLKLVQWASTAMLWQVLEAGCEIFLSPPPFDHTKLMIVDDGWVLFGSANWDPRSLRLNFELNVECYSEELARFLSELIDEKRARARQISLEEVDARPLPIRLRDGLARLLSPYL